MSADSLKVGARVQAGTATNAVERFAEAFVLPQIEPAVVHEHEMELAGRSVAVGQNGRGLERGRDDARIGCHRLAGGACGQQFKEGAKVFP